MLVKSTPWRNLFCFCRNFFLTDINCEGSEKGDFTPPFKAKTNFSSSVWKIEAKKVSQSISHFKSCFVSIYHADERKKMSKVNLIRAIQIIRKTFLHFSVPPSPRIVTILGDDVTVEVSCLGSRGHRAYVVI